MIVNCTISGNLSSHFGGGISCQNGDPIILSCIISGNSADTDGGGAYCAWGAPTMLNCTISGNSASAYGGGVYSKFGTPTLINCILWGDTAPEGDEIALRYSGGSLDLSYTDVQGGPNNVYVDSGSSLVWGGGNVDADPLFVDADGPDDDPNTWEDNDYHIKGKSPCKNTGDPNGDYADQTDIDGESRVMGPRVDMGADEKYKCGGGTEPLLAMMLLGGLTLIRRRR